MVPPNASARQMLASTSLRFHESASARPTERGGSFRLAAASPAANGAAQEQDQPPPGCSRVKLELTRPIGLVFEEGKEGGIFVAEVVATGKAARTGLVSVGDELIASSGVVYTGSDNYGGAEVKKGMQVVRVPVRGESFDGIMAAIGSHPGHVKVTLELQKCLPLVTASL